MVEYIPNIMEGHLPTLCSTKDCYNDREFNSPRCKECNAPGKVLGRDGSRMGRIIRGRSAPKCYLWIYFIEDEAADAVKIGYAKDVFKRFGSLQHANPRPLKLRAAFVGQKITEKTLHEEFEHCRIRGEWFKPDEKLLEVMERIAEGDVPQRYPGLYRLDIIRTPLTLSHLTSKQVT